MNCSLRSFLFNIKNSHNLSIVFVDFSTDVEYKAAISSHRLRVIFDNVTVFSRNVNQILRSLYIHINNINLYL